MNRIAFIITIIIELRPLRKPRMILFISLRANQKRILARNWDCWKKSCIKLSKQRKHRFSKRMWPYGQKARNWDGKLKQTPVAEENSRTMTGCPRHLRTILPWWHQGMNMSRTQVTTATGRTLRWATSRATMRYHHATNEPAGERGTHHLLNPPLKR